MRRREEDGGPRRTSVASVHDVCLSFNKEVRTWCPQ